MCVLSECFHPLALHKPNSSAYGGGVCEWVDGWVSEVGSSVEREREMVRWNWDEGFSGMEKVGMGR